MKTSKICNHQVSLHPTFGMFHEASGTKDNVKSVHNLACLNRRIGTLPNNAFEAANAITRYLVRKGWRYYYKNYCLTNVLSRKAGNCLGLSCLYGALLEARGFRPEYELVVGPKGYQNREEQYVLDHLFCGNAFPFHSPVLPEHSVAGKKLNFCTLEHPRLVLDGHIFETTILGEQEPSDITGEWIRRQRHYKEMVGGVYYERAHEALLCRNYQEATALQSEALSADSNNYEIYAEKAKVAIELFDDESFFQACEQYTNSGATHSQYWLNQYLLGGDETNLERSLEGNPTNMRAWTLKNVLHEKDIRTQRANFAIAAQCVARSEILNLGDFYAIYAAELAKLFPNNAVSLVKQSRDKASDVFKYHLALALLGSCKNVEWVSRDKPCDHFLKLSQGENSYSPLQKTCLLFAAKRLSLCNGEWDNHKCQFSGRRTFQALVDSLDWQWSSL